MPVKFKDIMTKLIIYNIIIVFAFNISVIYVQSA
jgi:hypothetical protein